MIKIHNLSLKSRDQYLLKRIDLWVKKGEFMGLLGPSGAGKTMLLRTIAGLETPSGGTIHLAGRMVNDPKPRQAPHLRRVAMVFQSLALWPHMTVRRHLEFVIPPSRFIDKKQKKHQVDHLIELMHLGGHQNRHPARLSGGEMQRLAIARALASEPDILLMDEPFASLDPGLKQEMIDITLSLKQTQGITVIYVSHQIDDTLSLADKVGFLNRGKITRQIETADQLTRESIMEGMGKKS